MRIRRVDKNQAQVVEIFRKVGFSVWHTHRLGSGFPDLCVGRNGYTHLIEVKNGSQKLTPDEAKFFEEFKGSKRIVESLEDVLKLHEELP